MWLKYMWLKAVDSSFFCCLTKLAVLQNTGWKKQSLSPLLMHSRSLQSTQVIRGNEGRGFMAAVSLKDSRGVWPCLALLVTWHPPHQCLIMLLHSARVTLPFLPAFSRCRKPVHHSGNDPRKLGDDVDYFCYEGKKKVFCKLPLRIPSLLILQRHFHSRDIAMGRPHPLGIFIYYPVWHWDETLTLLWYRRRGMASPI